MTEDDLATAEATAANEGNGAASREVRAKPRRSSRKAEITVGPVWLDLKQFRESRGERQLDFWQRFGVAQWTGSRYESDCRQMPRTVRMMVIAFALGMLSEDDLDRLILATESSERARQ